MVRQTTKVIIFEILGVLSLVAMAAIGILAFMLASGPVELGVFRDDVEQAITNARDGRPVTVERLTLQWSPSERRVFIVADGVSIKDKSGREAGFADEAKLTVDAGAMLLGRVEVLEVDMQTGWVELQNTAPNMWTLAGDPLPEIAAAALPQSPEEWLDRVNTVLGDVLLGLQVFDATLELETLQFTDLELRVLDAERAPIGTIAEAAGQIAHPDQDIAILFSGKGEGVGLPEAFSVSLNTTENYQTMRGGLEIGVLPIAELGQRLGVSGLEESDLELGTSFMAEVTRTDGLQQIGIVIEREAGVLKLDAVSDEISDLTASIAYLPAEDKIRIDVLEFDSERVQGVLRGEITNVLAQNELRRLDLEAETLRLDFTPRFQQAWALENVLLSADVSDDFTIFSIDA